jgi:hypothetical protein
MCTLLAFERKIEIDESLHKEDRELEAAGHKLWRELDTPKNQLKRLMDESGDERVDEVDRWNLKEWCRECYTIVRKSRDFVWKIEEFVKSEQESYEE